MVESVSRSFRNEDRHDEVSHNDVVAASPMVRDLRPEPKTELRLPADRVQPAADVAQSAPAAPAAAPVVVKSLPKRSWKRPILFGLLPVALVAGGYQYVTGGQVMSTDNAYVQARMLGLSTDVSGTVAEIDVHDNEAVKQGQVMFRLRPDSFKIALAGAEAQLGTVRNQVLTLQASYKQSLVQIDQARADFPYYETAFKRQQDLIASNVASKASFDQAQHDVISARQRILVSQAQAQSMLAQLGNADQPVEQNPFYLQAKSLVDNARRDLNDTVVKAQFDGIVTNVDALQVGAYLPASQQGFSLVSTTDLWVEASPKETELTYVEPGQTATVTIDTYPGAEWKGTVESINPASGASFALLPAQNTTGNWVKVVQRIPMRVKIDDTDGRPPLRVGMSAVVDVQTDHARGVPEMLNPLIDWFRPNMAEHAPAAGFTPVANRGAITACVILAVIMQALDTTIANVALPYIQGSVSASADQINWVLTSYIVAAAIMTPPSGYIANRFGRKRILLISIAGFVAASVLCGIAQSLMQIVGFRLLQGLFGAALVPLSQAFLLDIYPPEERGSAMALFGVSVMVGPVLGPVIGGWLTENISWRWVFYINLGIGAVAFAGVSAFVNETRTDATAKLDWLGFGTLSLTIAALQMALDRGEQLDWFASGEIIVEAVVAACAGYVFLVHTFTAKHSFVNPRLFLDRNFAVGMIFIFIVGVTYLASMALMTPYLQTLMGYPVVTAGIVMGPRGMGTMICMFLVGRIIGKVEIRWLLLIGLALTAWAMSDMTTWTPDVSQMRIVTTGFVQGAGLGFLFVPLTIVTFQTLPAEKRGDGTGLYNLSRNIGSSVGISVVSALLTENTQINHADIVSYITPFRAMLHNSVMSHMLNPFTAAGRAALDGMITTQAVVIAYMDDFKLMMLMCIAAMPLVFLLRKSAAPVVVDHSAVME